MSSLAALQVDESPEFDYLLAYDRSEVAQVARSLKLALQASSARQGGGGGAVRIWDEQDNGGDVPYADVIPRCRAVLLVLSSQSLRNQLVIDVLTRALSLAGGERRVVVIKMDGSAWAGQMFPPLEMVPQGLQTFFAGVIRASMAQIRGDHLEGDKSDGARPAVRYSRDYFAAFLEALQDRLSDRSTDGGSSGGGAGAGGAGGGAGASAVAVSSALADSASQRLQQEQQQLLPFVPLSSHTDVVLNLRALLLCLTVPYAVAAAHSPWNLAADSGSAASDLAQLDELGDLRTLGLRMAALRRFAQLYPSGPALLSANPDHAPVSMLSKLLRALLSGVAVAVRAALVVGGDQHQAQAHWIGFVWSSLAVLGPLSHLPRVSSLLCASPVASTLVQAPLHLAEVPTPWTGVGAACPPALPMLMLDLAALANHWLSTDQPAAVAALSRWMMLSASLFPARDLTAHQVLHPLSRWDPWAHAVLHVRLDAILVRAVMALVTDAKATSAVEKHVPSFLSLFPLLSQLLRSDLVAAELMSPLLFVASTLLVQFDPSRQHPLALLTAAAELLASAILANGGVECSASGATDGSAAGAIVPTTLQMEQLTSTLFSLSSFYASTDRQVATGLLFALQQLCFHDDSGACATLLLEHGMFETTTHIFEESTGPPTLFHFWLLEILTSMAVRRDQQTDADQSAAPVLSRGALLRAGGLDALHPLMASKVRGDSGLLTHVARWKGKWEVVYVAVSDQEKRDKFMQSTLTAAIDTLNTILKPAVSKDEADEPRAAEAPKRPVMRASKPHSHPLRPTPALDGSCSVCGLVRVNGSLMRCDSAGCEDYGECPSCYSSCSGPLHPHAHPLESLMDIGNAAVWGWVTCRVCQRTFTSGGGFVCKDARCCHWAFPTVFECRDCYPRVTGQRQADLLRHGLAAFRKAALDSQLQLPSLQLTNPLSLLYGELRVVRLAGAVRLAFGLSPLGALLDSPPGESYPGMDVRSDTGHAGGLTIQRTVATTPAWKTGDVIGLLVNLRTALVQCSVNGSTEGCPAIPLPGTEDARAWTVRDTPLHFAVAFCGKGDAEVELNLGAQPWLSRAMQGHSGVLRDAQGGNNLRSGVRLPGAPLELSAPNTVRFKGVDDVWAQAQASGPAVTEWASVAHSASIEQAHRAAQQAVQRAMLPQYDSQTAVQARAEAAKMATTATVLRLPGPIAPEPAAPESPGVQQSDGAAADADEDDDASGSKKKKKKQSPEERMFAHPMMASTDAVARDAIRKNPQMLKALIDASASWPAMDGSGSVGPKKIERPKPLYNVAYFEVTLLAGSPCDDAELALGFGPFPSSWVDHVGFVEGSVGAKLACKIVSAYEGELKWPKSASVKAGDVVGVGFDARAKSAAKHRFFFTHNGKEVLEVPQKFYNARVDLATLSLLPCATVNLRYEDGTHGMTLAFNLSGGGYKWSPWADAQLQDLSALPLGMGTTIPPENLDQANTRMSGARPVVAINGTNGNTHQIGLDCTLVQMGSVATLPSSNPLLLPPGEPTPKAAFAFYHEVHFVSTYSAEKSETILGLSWRDGEWDDNFKWSHAASPLLWCSESGQLRFEEQWGGGGQPQVVAQISRPALKGDTMGMGVISHGKHTLAFFTFNGRLVFVLPLPSAMVRTQRCFLALQLGYDDSVQINTGSASRPFLYEPANAPGVVALREKLTFDVLGDGVEAVEEAGQKKGQAVRSWKSSQSGAVLACSVPIGNKGKWMTEAGAVAPQAAVAAAAAAATPAAASSSSSSGGMAASADAATSAAAPALPDKLGADVPDLLRSSNMYQHYLRLQHALTSASPAAAGACAPGTAALPPVLLRLVPAVTDAANRAVASAAQLRRDHASHATHLASLRVQAHLSAHGAHEHWLQRVAPGAPKPRGVKASTCVACAKAPSPSKPVFVCTVCDVMECGDCFPRCSALLQTHPHKLSKQAEAAAVSCFFCNATGAAYSCAHCPSYGVCGACHGVQSSALQSFRARQALEPSSRPAVRIPPASLTADLIRRDAPPDQLGGQPDPKANTIAAYMALFEKSLAKNPKFLKDSFCKIGRRGGRKRRPISVAACLSCASGCC